MRIKRLKNITFSFFGKTFLITREPIDRSFTQMELTKVQAGAFQRFIFSCFQYHKDKKNLQ